MKCISFSSIQVVTNSYDGKNKRTKTWLKGERKNIKEKCQFLYADTFQIA